MREIEEQVVEDKKDEFWHKIWRPASSAGKRCHIYAMQVHWTLKQVDWMIWIMDE